jgi:nucleoside-diphosphate-sugar epimerase
MSTPVPGSVLVIGGAGFVAGFLVPALRERGWTVRTLDKLEHSHDGAQSWIGDVRDPTTLRVPMAGCDLIINLAAEHRDDVRPLSLYDDVNIGGAKIVCDVATECGITRQIFTSSVAVYGTQPAAITEDSPHDFFNDYGRTKHFAEMEYQKWRDADPQNTVVFVRPTVIFGPGNRGNVYNLLRQIKHGPFVMFGNGNNRKSMACVENIAGLITHLSTADFGNEVYNYADKPDFSMTELVAFADEVLGRSGGRRSVPGWIGIAGGQMADVASFVLRRPLPVSAVRVRKFMMRSEISKDKVLSTGFVPSVDMRDALRRMLTDHV